MAHPLCLAQGLNKSTHRYMVPEHRPLQATVLSPCLLVSDHVGRPAGVGKLTQSVGGGDAAPGRITAIHKVTVQSGANQPTPATLKSSNNPVTLCSTPWKRWKRLAARHWIRGADRGASKMTLCSITCISESTVFGTDPMVPDGRQTAARQPRQATPKEFYDCGGPAEATPPKRKRPAAAQTSRMRDAAGGNGQPDAEGRLARLK